HLLHAESLRLHYALTLEQWYKNFKEHVEEIEQMFDQRFVRMWGLYLQGCAASFRVSGLDIHQLLFSKGLNNQLPLTFAHLYR
ncbi:MAG: SAM-dependent methyltransferase, partial [Peptococcaceae bacterium]|nr:SAM-dependent methyltransferase [Peptococcaceae bacterium]